MSAQHYILISTPTTRPEILDEAVYVVKKAMGEVFVQQAPALFSEWYHCPALKIPSGRTIFGIDGIRKYVELHGAGEGAEVRISAG